MSKICEASYNCPFAPEQTAAGCPCADLCPGYVSSNRTVLSDKVIPGKVVIASGDTYNMKEE